MLKDLELEPLLDLGIRLGEGAGAAMAIPLVQSASHCLAEMTTFEEAGFLNQWTPSGFLRIPLQ